MYVPIFVHLDTQTESNWGPKSYAMKETSEQGKKFIIPIIGTQGLYKKKTVYD